VTELTGSLSPTPVKKRSRRVLSVTLVLTMLLLGGVSIYFWWQNTTLASANTSLQSATDNLRGNLTAFDSQVSILESQHSQLLSNRTNLFGRVVDLNSSLVNFTRALESFKSLSNRTVITSGEVVEIGACESCASAPTPTVSVVNFTAKYPGYVIVTIVTNPNVGEMFVSVWSNPTVCSEQELFELFCATGASPYFLGPGDSFLVPVLAGSVQIYLGNYNNYTVSASITVVLYD
jgi:hypothetical protein